MKQTIGALVAVLAAATPALAGDFAATPLNPGVPTNLPGETIIPGLPEALGVFNGVTQPILQPLLVPGAPLVAADAAVAPAPHHWHHHYRQRVAGHPGRHHRTA